MNPPEVYRNEVQKHIDRTKKSQQLQKDAEKYLPGGSSRAATWLDPYPIFAVRGSGSRLYDADDHEYIDFMINATSLILGHAHPRVVAALQDQANKGTAFGNPLEQQTELAKILCQRVPSIDKVRFVNSGSEATEASIKIARKYFHTIGQP